MRYKVEALQHLNTVYLVEADSADAAGDLVQAVLDGIVMTVLETLRSEVADAEVIGVYTADGEAQPSGPPV